MQERIDRPSSLCSLSRRALVKQAVRLLPLSSSLLFSGSAFSSFPVVDKEIESTSSDAVFEKLPASLLSRARRWQVPAESIVIDIRDLATDRVLLRYRSKVPHAPASTVKLLTTFAALEILEERKPDFRFETTLWQRMAESPGPMFVLEGGGDPCFDAETLEKLFAVLSLSGIDAIDGDILIDRCIFPLQDGLEPHRLSDHWRRRGWEQRWRVGPDAMSIGDRSVRFTFMPCEGGLAEVAMSPELDGVEWQRYVPLSVGRCVDWNKRLDPEVAHERDGSVRIFFRGNFSSECGKEALYLSLESADRYAERLIRTVCRQMGIEWTGRLLSRATVESPAWRLNYEPVSRVLSAPLPEIVRSINKDSLNAAAQSLFLALSDEHTNTASAVVVKRWLLENGIYCAHLHLPSGSGLDEKTRVDAVFMGDLLARAHSLRNGSPDDIARWNAFFESLPIAGVDGTMRRRGLPGVRARLKTGTLASTRALAGYLEHPSGKLLSVYASVTGPSAMPGATAFLDGVLLWATHLKL